MNTAILLLFLSTIVCFSYRCVLVIDSLRSVTVRFLLRELSIFLPCFEYAIKLLGSSSVPWRTISAAMETDFLSTHTIDSNSDFRGPRKDYVTAEHHGK